MVYLFKRHWSLFLALGSFFVVITVLLFISVIRNDGHLVYALDDTYIHMAIAKNFVEYGVWGINKHNFTSTSSSPLWTLLLSLTYLIFGVNEFSPFIMNIIFATLIILQSYSLLRKYIFKPVYIFIILLLVIFVTPLTALVFIGMEHTLHLLLTISVVCLTAKILSNTKNKFKEHLLLLILIMLINFVRYEGIFLMFIISVLLVIRKRFLYSLLIVFFGLSPIVIYGIISILNGWYFFPNTILIKSKIPEFSVIGFFKFFHRFSYQIVTNSDILVLLIVAMFFIVLDILKKNKLWTEQTIMLIILVSLTFLHMLFAETGSFLRYEAYLVGLGILILSIVMNTYLPDKIFINLDKTSIQKYLAIGVLIGFTILPFMERGYLALRNITQATTNIYEQQYQMGLFLKKFYQGEVVAANDIGAINFLADIDCFDLWGLANLDVAKLKLDRRYNSVHINELTKKKGVKIAIVYDHWFDLENIGGIPAQWIKIGQWKILNNIVCGGDIVSFYAVNTTEKNNLIKNFIEFSYEIPEDVIIYKISPAH